MKKNQISEKLKTNKNFKVRSTTVKVKPNKNNEIESTLKLELLLHMIEMGFYKPTEEEEKVLRKEKKEWWLEYTKKKEKVAKQWKCLEKKFGDKEEPIITKQKRSKKDAKK